MGQHGLRIDYAKLGGQGSCEMFRLIPDVTLYAGSFICPPDEDALVTTDEPWLMLRASLACNVTYQSPQIGELAFRHPGVVVTWIPAGYEMQVTIGTGRQQTLNLVCRGRGFSELSHLSIEDLPDVMRPAISGSDRGGIFASLPLDPRTASIITDVIASPMEGEMRRLHARGKVSELIAWTLSNLERISHPRDSRMRVRRRDLQLVRQAHEELIKTYARPPTIEALARHVGLNEQKLKWLFREVFGMTIHEFCMERRMQEAQRLLLEGEHNISQIAQHVGYEHQSSFSIAFKEHCGVAPREFRKQRPMAQLYPRD